MHIMRPHLIVYAVALKCQTHGSLRRLQLKKLQKQQDKTEVEWKRKETAQKCHIRSQEKKCFGGDNNVTELLQMWQANSEGLIANMYWHYCMNNVIKTHATWHFSSLATHKILCFFWVRLRTVLHMFWFLSHQQLFHHVIVSQKEKKTIVT